MSRSRLHAEIEVDGITPSLLQKILRTLPQWRAVREDRGPRAEVLYCDGIEICLADVEHLLAVGRRVLPPRQAEAIDGYVAGLSERELAIKMGLQAESPVYAYVISGCGSLLHKSRHGGFAREATRPVTAPRTHYANGEIRPVLFRKVARRGQCLVLGCARRPVAHQVCTVHYKSLKKVGMLPPSAPPPTHCLHGHEFTPENTRSWVDKRGHAHRACRECNRTAEREYRRRCRAEQAAAPVR